jgi:hypothetical protein
MLFSNHNRFSGAEDSHMKFPAICWRYMRFKKARVGFCCVVCDTRCAKGMRYIGYRYVKTCMKCAPTYMKNTVKGFEEWIQYIKDNIEICKTNEGKWMKDALVGSLESQGQK